MGSSNSKPFDPQTAGAGHRSRNVFQSSCIPPVSVSPGSSDIDHEQVSDQWSKENGAIENTSKLEGKTEQNENVEVKRVDETTCVSSEVKFGEWGESGLSYTVPRNGVSSSRKNSSILSHFNSFPGNISSIVSRATNSCSPRADLESSMSSTISNDEELRYGHSDDRNVTSEGCEPFLSCSMPMSTGSRDEDLNSDNSMISAIQELAIDTNDNRVESNENQCFPRNASGYDGTETRHVNRQNDAREPVEQNVLVRRTPSAAFPVELPSFPLQPEREVIDASEIHETGSHASNENAVISTTSSSYYPSPSIMSNSLYDGQDFDDEIERAREIGYHYLLGHTTNFLQRRRRIRSEIRALLQRGSRSENHSGHERSCILSGQHRTGQCACRLNNQDPRDRTNAMGGMSRIVYMAEALFEVMDEIHEQSLALLSRPSLPLTRSVPAPYEVVEALSVKPYSNLPKHLNEEDLQCYICLAEYEDGDEVRVLPCHHEFHKLCIDKWLKKIHRICPVCRGDVCRSGSSRAMS